MALVRSVNEPNRKRWFKTHKEAQTKAVDYAKAGGLALVWMLGVELLTRNIEILAPVAVLLAPGLLPALLVGTAGVHGDTISAVLFLAVYIATDLLLYGSIFLWLLRRRRR